MFGVDWDQTTTLAQLLNAGWAGSPGTPLVLIAVSAVTAVTVSLVRRLDTIRAGAAIAFGLVTLLASTWLWEGFSRIQSGAAVAPLPVTGAVLAAIGAFVMIAVGFYLWSFQRARTARPAIPEPRSPGAEETATSGAEESNPEPAEPVQPRV